MKLNESMLLVTGMSGAGKTEAMKALEDLGFFCIDNLPPPLLKELSNLPALSPEQGHSIAVAMDVRGRAMFNELHAAIDRLRDDGVAYQILFLDCADDVLVRRYSETRRSHPVREGHSLFEKIAAERCLLAEMRESANLVFDTTHTKAHELNAQLGHLILDRDVTLDLRVDVMSFGFKYGVPLDADLMFDVRFLTNPHYDLDLRPQTGLDAPVADYVFAQPEALKFVEDVVRLLERLTPLYAASGKARLTVAIGCTGGQHRSVAITERLAHRLGQHFNNVVPVHRDMRKNITLKK
jgi:RNase adapter protein RapZ